MSVAFELSSPINSGAKISMYHVAIAKKNASETRGFRGVMERVTRLELATSTLARWRSTG